MTYTKKEIENILYRLDAIGAIYARDYFYKEYYYNRFTVCG